MKYLSVAQIAKMWKRSERSVRNYCANGQIQGAVLSGKTWQIPENAIKPERSNKQKNIPTTLFEIIKELTGNNTIIRILQEMLIILKYPLTLLILFINIKTMYVIAPDKEIPSHTTNKGAMLTTVGWVLSTEIFAFYIERFATYDVFYGSISNILVLLLWVYLLSYIYVLGMVINASIYKEESDTK